MAEIDRLEILVTADTAKAMKNLSNLQKKIASLDGSSGTSNTATRTVTEVTKSIATMDKALTSVKRGVAELERGVANSFSVSPVAKFAKELLYADVIMQNLMRKVQNPFADAMPQGKYSIVPWQSEGEKIIEEYDRTQRMWEDIRSGMPNFAKPIFGDNPFGSNAIVSMKEFNDQTERTEQLLRDASAIDVPFEEIEEGTFRASRSTELWADNIREAMERLNELSQLGGQIYSANFNGKDAPSREQNADDGENATNIANAMSQMSQNLGRDLMKNFVPMATLKGLDALKSALTRVAQASQVVLRGLSKIGNALLNIGVGAGKAGLSLATLPFKSVANKIKNTIKSYSKLMSSIKRVVLYRTLRAVLKAVTDGFNEGIKAMSRYSRSIGGDFSKTMDEISSQMALLRGSIGAMASPLIQMVKPAIMAVTNAVINLANAINQLFSLMSGKNGWTKATNAVEQYDDAIGGASSSQKELTAGIDELNILNENGGGGGVSTKYEFDEMAFDNWAQKLKELWDLEKYYDFGKSLAEIFNDKIADWDALASGRKLGEKIQSVIEASYGFWKNLNTESLGVKIGEFLNNAIKAIDTFMWGQAWAEKWNRFVDLVYGFVTTFEWDTLAIKLTNWVKGALDAFNVQKLADTITALVSGLLTFIDKTIETFPLTGIIQAFFDLFNGIRWYELGLQIGDLASDLVNKLIETLCDLIQNHDIAKTAVSIARFVGGAIEGVNWTLISLYVSKLVWVIVQDINSMLAWGIPTAIESAVTGADFDSLMNERMLNSAQDGLTLIYDATEKSLRDIDIMIENEINKDLAKSEDGASKIADYIKTNSAEASNAVAESTNKISTSIGNAVAYTYDEVNGCMQRIGSVLDDGSKVVANTAQEMGNSFAQPWSQFQELGDKVEDFGNKTSQSYEKIQTVTSTSWEQIKNTTSNDWDAIQTKVENTWKLLATNADVKFKEIVKTITDAWIEMKSATNLKFGKDGEIYVLIDNALAQIQGAFSARFDGDTSIQNFVVGAFNSMESGIKTALDTTYTHIDTFVTNAINRIGDLIREIERYNIEAEGSDLDIELSGIKAYAGGGFVSSGQLFMARENGLTEMVGSFGGRTAVANNDQIVEGISSGVYSAVLNAMSQTNGTSNINVYLDGKKIEASVRDTRQRRGATIASGGVINYA